MHTSRTVRIAGIGFAVVLILLGRHLVPRSGSSINNPRPVEDATLAPGPFESLADSLRLRSYPPLQLDVRQEKALAECIKLSRLVNHRVNGVAKFDATTTRDELLTWREQMSPAFYAEFLLAKWHERQGDASEAERWMQQSLEHAPVVLVRRYELLDGGPLAHTVVGELGVECRMKTRTSANDYEELKYIDLTTDEDGRVYLPCYDTRIRSNSVQHPAGYDVELGRHGYLELQARYNLLPPIRLWPEGRPRPATDLPPSEFYDYRKARQIEGLSHRIAETELRIERCYRLYADGTFGATDGRKEVGTSDGELPPSFAYEHPSLDQAMIRLDKDSGGYEILQVRLFDHRTRTLLTEYHVPAIWSYDGASAIFGRSFTAPLPEEVDVWFWITTFNSSDAKQEIAPQVGAKATFEAYDAELTHLHGGRRGYSTTQGTVVFQPARDQDDFPVQAAFRITPKRAAPSNGRFARVVAVHRDGSRILSDRVIYPSNPVFVCEFPMEPAELDHFELFPMGREECFFFDSVRLPPAPDLPLAGSWETTIRTEGREGAFSAPDKGPARLRITMLAGHNSISFSSRHSGDLPLTGTRWTCNSEGRHPSTRCTIVCEIHGLPTRTLETEIVPLTADGSPTAGAGRGSWHSGNLTSSVFRVPVDRIHAVRVRLSTAGDVSESGIVVEKRLH